MEEWRTAFGWILVAAFSTSCVVGIIAWIFVVYSLVRLPFNAKPTQRPWMVTLNPLNVAFYPELLTPRGLAIRRRLGKAVFVFFLALILAAAIGLLAKLGKPT